MKIVLVEGAGRYSLATGRTIFEGWRSLGIWTTWYFAPYIVVWGFVYGAAAMAGTGLALYALFDGLSVTWWGILSGLIGLALVWTGRYGLFEKVLAALVGLMFVTMVGAAAVTLPNLPELLAGLVPTHPRRRAGQHAGPRRRGRRDDHARGVRLLAPGEGLEHAEATCGVMRIDNRVAYAVTGLFVVATLIVGAELLYSANIAVATGDKGMLDLSNVLADRYGDWMGTLFLVGFWAAAMSSLVGVWNGVSLMFADFMGNVTGKPTRRRGLRAGGRWYKAYILWLTFPPMIMLFLGEPVWLILAYGVLGAFFMPFLAVTLLWILNTDRTPREWRNKIVSNVAMALCALAFAALAVNEIRKAIAGI